VLVLNPDFPEALLELANLRTANKKLEQAAVLLRRYVKVSRNPSTGYYKLAMVERSLHQMDAAQRDLSVFQTLSKNTSAGPYPYQHLFDYLDNRSALDAKEQTQLDLTELTAQIQKHPDQPRDLYLLAEANLKLGKADEARKAIAQLDEISAADYRTQTGVGVLLARFRLYNDAIQHFQAALKANPDSDDVKYDLADAYFRKGSYAEALDAAEKVSATGQQDDTFLSLLGDIQVHLGETARAAEIFFASAATVLETEPNDTADKAQKLAAPVELTGQFQTRGDIDLYQFDAKAAEVFWIEVFGQRSSSPADPVLIIDQVKKNDKGEETLTRVTAVDDNATNIGATLFNTTTDDPVFRLAVPADGTYRIAVRDRASESHGDPSFVYRLSIRKETPDFRLVAIPSFPTVDPNLLASVWDLGLRKGDNAQMTVMAFRRDGFNGVIDVIVEGLPAGVTCPGASIGPGQVSTMLVFSANEQAPEWQGAIRILGKGRLEDAALIKAVTDQETAKRGATAQLSALDKAVATAADALKAATEKATAAKTALDGDANNEALKKAKADADAAVAKATEEAQKATDAKAAGDKKIADLNAALAAAQAAREQAARDVVRVARGGTIVWGGNPAAQQASHSRLARTITLAVLKETAPFQIATDATRFSVNQGSQILVPFKLLKRPGFDNNVSITFVTPPQNLQTHGHGPWMFRGLHAGRKFIS
jgi:tetratricopeptide (TPR) repeat protein